MQERSFNIFASNYNMIRQLVNETKWSSLLVRTGALILYISIWKLISGPKSYRDFRETGPSGPPVLPWSGLFGRLRKPACKPWGDLGVGRWSRGHPFCFEILYYFYRLRLRKIKSVYSRIELLSVQATRFWVFWVRPCKLCAKMYCPNTIWSKLLHVYFL